MVDFPSGLADALRDRYALERELGRGGMATVYLAQDVKHDRPVALKVLHPELAATLGPERFQREIRFAARLQHPHILTVLDSGESAGQLWFAMPYVEGESLRDRLRRERQLAVEDALRITREAAQALQYAHEHGVVHRDIKPENLLLTRDGNTLVADFGIARALRGEEQLTQTGIAIGTPAYMSPEQASGDKAIDARTDVYSLGAVLFEMLAGEPPYTGPTAQAMLAKRFSGPVPSVRRGRPSVPEAVDQSIQRALAPVPADRFATAADFARALQPTAATAAPTTVATPVALPAGPAAPISPPVSRARRLPVAAITLGLGFLIGLGVLFAWRRSHVSTEGSAGPKRVAVLPFENLGDSADAYFTDGVTDAVRDKLASVPGLEVIASASSAQYRNTTKVPQQIARELGTQYLLIGKVRWAKRSDGTSRVQVRPELVEAASGAERWGEPFDAALTDVFQVQAEIASQVAGALNVALGALQHQSLERRPTENLAAYDAYLRGRAAEGRALAEADPVKEQQALRYFEQALALDPTLVDAWVELAINHTHLSFQQVSPTDTTDARKAVEHAVALAPGTPQVQLALGVYTREVLRDPAKARAAYDVGLKSAPNDTRLLSALCHLEFDLGRLEEAAAYAKRAEILDPRSESASEAHGLALQGLRRYPEASAAYAHAQALAPSDMSILIPRIEVRLAQGDLAGARKLITEATQDVDSTKLFSLVANWHDLGWVLDSAQQAVVLHQPWDAFGDHPAYRLIIHAQIYHWRGDQTRRRIYADSARRAFDDVLRARPYLTKADQYALLGLGLAYVGEKPRAMREGERGVARALEVAYPWDTGYIRSTLARIYAVVGEPAKAVDQIEILLKTPTYFGARWFRIDPNFAPLRGNPRFERLVAGK